MSTNDRILASLIGIGLVAVVVVPFAHRSGLGPFADDADSGGLAQASTPPVTAAPTPTAPPPTLYPTPLLDDSVAGAWRRAAGDHRGRDGDSFVYTCPPDGPFGEIWGSDTYTDDSSVCTAAVHHGVIAHDVGGTVTIIIRPGLAAYRGSTANGVTSLGFPAWPGSYSFDEG